MKVIIFREKICGRFQQLKRTIGLFIPTKHIIHSQNVFEFVQTIHRHRLTEEDIAVVLWNCDKNNLKELSAAKDELMDTKIILILSIKDEDLLSQGLKFFPRFISYVENDFLQVGAVLNRMLKNKSAIKQVGCNQ